MTLVKDRSGTGKTASDWGVLDLCKGSDGFLLALMNFCSGGKSHHGDFAHGDAALRLRRLIIALRT